MSAQQQEQFNSFFAQVQKEYSNLFGFDIVASVRRLGLITIRIAMILTSLRIIDGSQISNFIGCDDSDFQTAITMARVLLQHTAKVFGSLPTTESNAQNGQTVIRQTFLDNLPPEFDRKTYLAVAEKLKIPPRPPRNTLAAFALADNSSTSPTIVTASRNIVICTFQESLKMGLYIYLLAKNVFSMSKKHLRIDIFCTFASLL